MKLKDLQIKSHPVPNYTPGRTSKIRYGVIHFVSCRNYGEWKNDPYNIKGILQLFDDLGKTAKFSCHDIIDREGVIYELVNIKDTAWGVGSSVIDFTDYIEYLNPCTLNIELVCKEEDKYTQKQYEALAALAVLRENQVVDQNLGEIEHWVGHSWVSGTICHKLGIKKKKSSIKTDPGKNFDFDLFNRERYRIRLIQEVMFDCKEELRLQLKKEITKEVLKELTISQLFSTILNKFRKK